MAETGLTAVIESDICEAVSQWSMCERFGEEYVISTHCQFPSGSLIKARVRRSEDGWKVSDGGASIDEVTASGVEKPDFGMNVRRVIRTKGLHFVDGRIETPKIQIESLFNAVTIIANTARDIAETLLFNGSNFDQESLDSRARKILVGRFHALVLNRPLHVEGASERLHKFSTAMDLQDGRRLLIDTVKHQGNSINSSIVSNLDIKRLKNPKFVQRIVFDPLESWKTEEIELLNVGATPVALPSLISSVERIAA